MRIWTPLLAVVLLVASCADSRDEAWQPERKMINVTVGSAPRAGIGIESRTMLGEDGVTVRWADDDRIAMWAVDASDNEVFSATTFSLWHYSSTYDRAKFRGDVPEMAQGEYTYYAVSPLPASTSNTQATYTIPNVQNGTFDGACDVMVASPITGGALVEGDNNEAMQLRFHHKIHVLKIRVTGSDLGEPIHRLEITFPGAVTGNMTVDAAYPEMSPVLTSGSNVLTINLAEPITGERTVYAIIAPVEFTADQQVEIRAYGERRQSLPGTFAGKEFAEGHTTPIRLRIPEADAIKIYIDLTESGDDTLGEPITQFTLSADGATFDNGGSTRTFTSTGEGRYEMTFYDYPASLEGKTVTVEYESEHALITRSFTMPQIIKNKESVASLAVPYLYEEYFDGLTASFENGTVHKTSDSKNYDPITLDQYGLPGWSGVRIGGQTGTSLRICSRVEGGMGIMARYNGRADSAPLSNLKASANVNVSLSFDYSSARYNAQGGNSGNPLLTLGHTTTQGSIKIGTDLQNVVMTDKVLENDTSGTENTLYGTLNHAITGQQLNGVTAQSRISWLVENNRGSSFAANGMYWLYIDNIRVSITK